MTLADGIYRTKYGHYKYDSVDILYQLEVAADNWWKQFSPDEKQAYLRAHPQSKFGRTKRPIIHLDPDDDAIDEQPYKPIAKKNLQRISLLSSEYAGNHAAGIEGRFMWHMDQGHYGTKIINAHPDDIRASQGWVDRRWTPEWSKGTPIPVGLIDEKAIIHLLDGHHRSDYSARNHKRIRIRVVLHTRQDENAYQRVKHTYGE